MLHWLQSGYFEMVNVQNLVNGVEKTQFSYPHGTHPPPSSEPMSCTLAGSETADHGDHPEVSDVNFEVLAFACEAENPCNVVVNEHTDGSAAEAFVNADSASLAAAAASLADKSVQKDAHVGAAPSIGSVVGETVDLIVEAFAGPDAAASFGVLHVGMEIAVAVVGNHAAETHDQLVLLVHAELGDLVLKRVQESELASVLWQSGEEAQKVFHTE